MIEKELDMVLVGKNYLSYLLGLELIERKQKILLLDDDRLSYGELYTDSLPLLEIEFLKTWGADKDIAPLKNIEKYLMPRALTLAVGDELVRLGGSAAHNFLEIARKVPGLFPKSLEVTWPYETEEGAADFTSGFEDFCKRVAQNAFRFKSVQSFDTAVFFADCSEDLKSCFESFEEVYRKMKKEGHSKYEKELTYFFMARGKFQKKFSMDLTRFELFHLFITLLSPLYDLDQESLLKDLDEVILERGGNLKRTRIREWLFYKSKPWSLELSSYDGIIHPKSISLLGADPAGLSIKLENKGQSYGCVRAKLLYKENSKIHWKGEKFLRSEKKLLGTENPLWEIDFGENSVLVKMFTKKLECSKIGFHRESTIKTLESNINNYYPGLWSELEAADLEWGPEIWIEGQKDKSKGEIPFPRSVSVTNVIGPMKEERLGQVYYFGPYKEGPLGLLSSLMEIKDGQQFL